MRVRPISRAMVSDVCACTYNRPACVEQQVWNNSNIPPSAPQVALTYRIRHCSLLYCDIELNCDPRSPEESHPVPAFRHPHPNHDCLTEKDSSRSRCEHAQQVAGEIFRRGAFMHAEFYFTFFGGKGKARTFPLERATRKTPTIAKDRGHSFSGSVPLSSPRRLLVWWSLRPSGADPFFTTSSYRRDGQFGTTIVFRFIVLSCRAGF